MKEATISGSDQGIVLLDQLRIKELVRDIACKVNSEFQNRKACPIIMPILEGGLFFAADLMKQLDFNFEVQSVKVKTYSGHQPGQPSVQGLVPGSVLGRLVLLVDDVCDTGVTLTTLRTDLLSVGALHVYTCTLLVRDMLRHEYPSFFGELVKPDLWLYGYGMDYAGGQLRNLGCIKYVPKSVL